MMTSSSLYMPAEWHPHVACLLLCPHNPATFRLEKVTAEFLQVARAIAGPGQEDVLLFCHDEHQLREYEAATADDARITCTLCVSNDSWARDTGPTFVLATCTTQGDSSTTSLVGLDWEFNAYGGPVEGCYWPCEQDRHVAQRMIEVLTERAVGATAGAMVTHRSVPLVLEGGSIHTDGQGTILTTQECLLHPNRNPGLSPAEIEQAVLQATGGTTLIWLETGLAHDEDTNGHVDNWACFCRPGHVILAWTDDAVHQADNYQRCRRSLAQLEAAKDAAGCFLTVHKLYLPSPMAYAADEVASLTVPTPTASNPAVVQPREVGEVLAASYVNFYIANATVIVPQFGDPVYDDKALETLRPLFPDRTVVGVPSREILIGGGNLHCITQQVPQS
jgi:agmatine deiminase